MATVTTTVQPVLTRFPFVGLPEPAQRKSVIPTAELVFDLDPTEIVNAPGAGNDRSIIFECNLPNNFSYVLVEAVIRIFSSTNGVTPAWETISFFSATDQGKADRISGCTAGCVFEATQDGRGQQIYEFLGPKYVFGANSSIDFYCADTNLNGPQDRFKFFARFLQYDLNQKYHHEVNTPVLTR